MIDKYGFVRCSNSKCGKGHAIRLKGELDWYCPRCHHFNRDKSPEIYSEPVERVDSAMLECLELACKQRNA